jgi:hypothetical protein
LKTIPVIGATSELDVKRIGELAPTLFVDRQARRGLTPTWETEGDRVATSSSKRSPKTGVRTHLAGIGDGIRDLLAKKFAIPLPKPVNHHLDRPLGVFISRARRPDSQ